MFYFPDFNLKLKFDAIISNKFKFIAKILMMQLMLENVFYEKSSVLLDKKFHEFFLPTV